MTELTASLPPLPHPTQRSLQADLDIARPAAAVPFDRQAPAAAVVVASESIPADSKHRASKARRRESNDLVQTLRMYLRTAERILTQTREFNAKREGTARNGFTDDSDDLETEMNHLVRIEDLIQKRLSEAEDQWRLSHEDGEDPIKVEKVASFIDSPNADAKLSMPTYLMSNTPDLASDDSTHRSESPVDEFLLHSFLERILEEIYEIGEGTMGIGAAANILMARNVNFRRRDLTSNWLQSIIPPFKREIQEAFVGVPVVGSFRNGSMLLLNHELEFNKPQHAIDDTDELEDIYADF